MRLGINFAPPHRSPEHWGDLLVKKGYRATCLPVDYHAPVSLIDRYMQAAKDRDILIAELGVWDSPFQPDEKKAAAAKERALEQFRLADYVGARCCVNVAGSAGEPWFGWCKENYSKEMYDRIVAFVQKLCDTVKPEKTVFSLEPMQWMVPYSPEQYAQLLKDVNRDSFKVHMDIWNWINQPYWYTHQEELMEKSFALLKDDIVSCHIKDVRMAKGLTVEITETPIGTGEGNHLAYLKHIDKLDPDMPVLIEHLKKAKQYDEALEYLKNLWEGNK